MLNKFNSILAILFCLTFVVQDFGQAAVPKTSPLKLNVPIEGSFTTGGTQTFALHLESDQFAVLELEPRGVDVRITVDNAKDGKRQLEFDFEGNIFGKKSFLLESGDKSCDWLVRIISNDEKLAVSGKFSFALVELKTPAARDKLRLAAQTAYLDGAKLYLEDKKESQEKGIALVKNALKLTRQSGDPILEKDILVWMQNSFSLIGDLTESVEYGNAALALLAGQENAYARVRVKNLIGFALVEMGEAQKSVAVLSEILPSAHELGDRWLESNILASLSLGYQRLNDTAKGIEFAEQGRRIAKEIGSQTGQMDCLAMLSRSYTSRSDFGKAIEILNEALKIAAESETSIYMAVLYDDLSGNYIALGHLQKALDSVQKGLAVTRDLGGSKYAEAIELSVIAGIYSQMGQNTRALEYNRQATQLFSEFGDRDAIYNAQSTKGAIYRDLKDFKKAKEVYVEMLKLFEQSDDKLWRSKVYNFLGLTENNLGHPEAAAEYYLKAAQIRNELKMKRLEAASLDAAASVLIVLGQSGKADEITARVLEMSRSVGDRVTESNALYTLARIRRGQKNLSQAKSLIEDSLKIVESLRSEIISRESRTAYFSTVREKYDFYIDLLLEMQSQPENKEFGALAFAASERARARGLHDLLAESSIDVSAGIKPELKERERRVEAKLSALQTQLIRFKSAEKQDATLINDLQKEIKKADDEREIMEAEIRSANPLYANLKYPTTLDLAQTQAMLDDQTLLLEYQTGAEASYLFAVGKNEFQIVKLPNEKTLRGAIEILHKSISTPTRVGLANYLVTGRELYNTLLAPVENLLKTKTKIIVAADGALHYLPFEALLRNNTATSLDKLPYLVRDFEISYTPSASVLANLKSADQAAKPAKSFLAFAAPDYGTKTANENQINTSITRSVFGENQKWNLTDLQFAKAEATRIAKLFPAGQSTVLTGAEATEEQVKATDFLSQYRYLHFAVHGLIDEEQPQFSSLVLSLPKPAEQSKIQNLKSKIEEDGLLQTPEIFNLRLRADLVTLSACETGLGQEMRGEGIVGLTRAFFYAGTPSVLVSLWKVDDASTADLMTLFYEHLQKNNGRDKAAALRESQLKLIAGNRYAHPYYWASFILQGKTNSD